MFDPRKMNISRRDLLGTSYLGLGGLALLNILSGEQALGAVESRANPLEVRPQQLPAKAKSCIFLFMEGGVSQMDTVRVQACA